MNPREQLKEHIAGAIVRHCSLGMSNAINECDAIIDKLAIGRWVPVEERLPDISGDYVFRWQDGTEQRIYYTHVLTYGEKPTHWLELDIPEVEG